MQKPYTKKAEKVLEIAKKASRSMHHSYIGTEHLLIGLLGEGSGAAAKVLSSAGVDEERILELNREPDRAIRKRDRSGCRRLFSKNLKSA